jgi:hypothetical protein
MGRSQGREVRCWCAMGGGWGWGGGELGAGQASLQDTAVRGTVLQARLVSIQFKVQGVLKNVLHLNRGVCRWRGTS